MLLLANRSVYIKMAPLKGVYYRSVFIQNNSILHFDYKHKPGQKLHALKSVTNNTTLKKTYPSKIHL